MRVRGVHTFGYVFEPADVAIVLTLLLLEGVLSFDNAAVLAAMVRKVAPEQRRKALLYGLAGAYAFRIAAVLGVSFIVKYPALKLVGGGYLLYLAVKHLWPQALPQREKAERTLLSRLGVSGFWAIVISIELTDVAFALDQVLVAVAMTDKVLLIIVASMIAILVLRVSAAVMSRLMDWFPALEKLAYIAVGFVGVKLVLVEVVHYAGGTEFEVPKVVSIAVTLSLLVLPILGKLLLDRIRERRPRAG